MATAMLAMELSGCSTHPENRTDSTSISSKSYSPDFYEEWRVVGKMDFATMTVTKTVTTERTAWYKIGDRIAVYSFDIYLRSYIDMEDLQPSDIMTDTESKTIYIKLPQVKSEITGRSTELREEYADIGFFRSRPDSKERAALKEKAYSDFEREFKSNPSFRTQLETAALRKARSYFQSLGESAGYKVVFSNSLPFPIQKG